MPKPTRRIQKTKIKTSQGLRGTEWAEKTWGESWTYIRTMVDTIREPFIILDKNLSVIAANETFYRTFQVPTQDTENKLLFELGDGQWNIPALRKLLRDILHKDTFFRGFEVEHKFPTIGDKIMLLNARRIHQKRGGLNTTGPLILLAIEDITEITTIAKKLSEQTKHYETQVIERTEELEARIAELTQLNKTVMGFDTTMTGLTTMVEDLRGEIATLSKN